jgi:hypothetical protein
MVNHEYFSEFPDGTQVRWRPIKWGEFKSLKGQYKEITGAATWLLLEAVAARCIIDFISPDGIEDYDDLPAGTVSVIGEQILDQTGFMPMTDFINEKLGQYRAEFNPYYDTMVARISHYFHFRPEELLDWDLPRMMYHILLLESLGMQVNAVDKDKVEKQPTMQGPDGRIIPLITKDQVKRTRRG